ncbi:hypothetical protein ASB57_13755 [Bordetella sp. N]|nr:hypothetical protein ASB57_13755 [Bordetella sp. N]
MTRLLPLPRLLALTAAVTGLALSLLFFAFQLSFGEHAAQIRETYTNRSYVLAMALDWTANLALTSLIVYACTRAYEDGAGALPVAARRRVQLLMVAAVVGVTLAMQMLWVALYPILLTPILQWGADNYRPYAAPLIMQGIGVIQTIIAGLLVSLITLTYARRIAPALAYDDRTRPVTPAERSAAVIFGWTWLMLQMQLMRPAFGLYSWELNSTSSWTMLLIILIPLLVALLAKVAATKPLADLQPWRAAPGRAILASVCAFITAQLLQFAVAFGLAYTLRLSTLLRFGFLTLIVVTLIVYLIMLVPLSRLYIRLFYRREGSAAAPAAA